MNSLSGNGIEAQEQEAERIHREALERDSNERMEKFHKERIGRADRDKAINALMGSRSVMEAARNSGISRGTFYNFMKDADFMAAFNDLKKEQRDRLEDQIFDLGEIAAVEIKKLFETNIEKTNPYGSIQKSFLSLKIKTALNILDFLSRIHAPPPIEPPGNRGTGINVNATLPENTDAIAGAFIATKKTSP